jgi:transcriptional regulator with XRE-family HTH domain
VSPEQAFGAVLRELRQERGWSQEAFAELSRCSRPHVSRLESGRNSPSLSMLFQVAAALDVQPAELIARAQVKLAGVAGDTR